MLIHGPRQCGKTTLARHVGKRAGSTHPASDDAVACAGIRTTSRPWSSATCANRPASARLTRCLVCWPTRLHKQVDCSTRHRQRLIECCRGSYSRPLGSMNCAMWRAGTRIVDGDDGRDIFEHPAFVEIRAAPDQRTQLGLLAAFSRGVLERTYTAHCILRSAATADPEAAKLRQRDLRRRRDAQRRNIQILQERAPLRAGLST
ncbi:MAG: hypothetical protein RL684_2312, partial [Pseudomonadota bacterium]